MRSTVLFFLLLAGLSAAGAAPASAQISVDSLRYTLKPMDGVVTLTLPVHSESSWPTEVVVEIRDYEVEADGRHRFLPLGTVAGSCGGRIEAAPRTLTVAPFATAEVVLTFRGGAADRCENIVFLTTHARDSDPAGEDVALVIRTGVKLEIRP
jgi:hypothetical protein